MRAHFILFVHDQVASTDFFRRVLQQEPRLHEPGMTEFDLGAECVLGLMPWSGAHRLLGVQVPLAATAAGELYLHVPSPEAFHGRAIAAGAVELSPLERRPWGDEVAYSQSPDGVVLAFARRVAQTGGPATTGT